MSDHIKDTKDTVEAINALRTELESKNVQTAESKEKVEKIEAKLAELEEVNQENTKKFLEAKQAETNIKEQYTDLESRLYRMPAGGCKKVSDQLKAFEKALLKGSYALSVDEVKYLRTDKDPQAGYLAPSEFINEIIKDITEVSPIRSISRVRNTSRGYIELPVRKTLLSSTPTGQGGAATESQSSYGMEQIFVKKMTAETIVTHEMLSDAAFDIGQEIRRDMIEEFARQEGFWYVKGNGVLESEGFLNNSDIQQVNSGIANDIDDTGIIKITGELKSGYNGMYVFNRRTLARIRTLKSTAGGFLWQANLAAGAPNTLNGEPYVLANDMPDIAVDSLPLAYGDFMRGFTVVDNVQMNIIRDDFTLASDGQVKFVGVRRTAGQTVQPEALKLLKCST